MMKHHRAIFCAITILVGCGDEHTRARGEFIAVCMHGRGASKEICWCAFEKLESHYGEQLRSLMKASNPPPELPGRVSASLLECDGRTASTPKETQSTKEQTEARVAKALSTPSTNSNQEPSSRSNSLGRSADNPSKDLLNAAIAKMIENETSAIGGTEFSERRKVVEADFNGDGAMDAVVLYTIEGADGSNASRQTLVLLHRNTYAYAPQDSIDVSGVLDIALNADHSISTTIAIHAPNDADCCPSLREQHTYRTDKGRLARIKE